MLLGRQVTVLHHEGHFRAKSLALLVPAPLVDLGLRETGLLRDFEHDFLGPGRVGFEFLKQLLELVAALVLALSDLSFLESRFFGRLALAEGGQADALGRFGFLALVVSKLGKFLRNCQLLVNLNWLFWLLFGFAVLEFLAEVLIVVFGFLEELVR